MIMAMKVLAMLVVMMAVVQDSRAAVNKNGEPTGWTTIDNIDYKIWPASRTSHGDIISEFFFFPVSSSISSLAWF